MKYGVGVVRLCVAVWLRSRAPCGSAVALKGSIHRPDWTGASLNCARSFSSKHLWCPKNVLKETQSTGKQSVESALCLPLARSSLPVSARHKPFSHVSPEQSALPLWLALCLCWRSVPAFRGNNYCCIPHSEQTLWQKLSEIKLCLYGFSLCCCSELYRMTLSKFDLPRVIYHWYESVTNKENALVEEKPRKSSANNMNKAETPAEQVCLEAAAVTLDLTSIWSLPDIIACSSLMLSPGPDGGAIRLPSSSRSTAVHHCTAALPPYLWISVLGDHCRSTLEILVNKAANTIEVLTPRLQDSFCSQWGKQWWRHVSCSVLYIHRCVSVCPQSSCLQR